MVTSPHQCGQSSVGSSARKKVCVCTIYTVIAEELVSQPTFRATRESLRYRFRHDSARLVSSHRPRIIASALGTKAVHPRGVGLVCH